MQWTGRLLAEDQTRAPVLTPADVTRLTLWKWKYVLESHGFTPIQASHLIFLRILAERGDMGGPGGRDG